MTATDIHGNYRLTNVREMGGFETRAFTAALTHNGKKIADAENRGTGGPTLLWFYDGRNSKAEKDFYVAAQKITGWDFEPEAIFCERLLLVAEMDRKRGVVLVFDGDNVWEEFTYRTISAASKAERAEIIPMVARAHANKNPRFWDKKRGDFVPADRIS